MHPVQFYAGNAGIKKTFMASESMTTAGVPVIGVAAATTDVGGVQIINNAAEEGIVGLLIDGTADAAGTDQYPSSTPGSLVADASIFVSVVCNPNVAYRARLSGGATSGTALTLDATSGASSDGSTLTGVTTLDDGVVWGYDGANAGVHRRADDAAGSVSISFPNAVASGDNFLVAPGFPGMIGIGTQAFFDLTSDFTEINATASDSDNDNFVIVDLDLKDLGGDGTLTSHYHIVPNNHALAGNLQHT